MNKIKLTNSKYAEINITNARQLQIKSNVEYPDIIKTNDNITGLNYYDNFSISLGNTLQIDNSGKKYNYVINYIEEDKAGIFILYEDFRNKTSMFLFPLITKIGTISSNYFYTPYYYNTYLYCNKYPKLNKDNHLFVVYRFFNHHFYTKFESDIQKHSNLVDSIDISADKVLFIFEIPEQHLECINLFKNGDYLKFPKKSIHKLLNFYSDAKGDVIIDVLKNSNERRSAMEYKLKCKIPKHIPTFSKPILTNETLKL